MAIPLIGCNSYMNAVSVAIHIVIWRNPFYINIQSHYESLVEHELTTTTTSLSQDLASLCPQNPNQHGKDQSFLDLTWSCNTCNSNKWQSSKFCNEQFSIQYMQLQANTELMHSVCNNTLFISQYSEPQRVSLIYSLLSCRVMIAYRSKTMTAKIQLSSRNQFV